MSKNRCSFNELEEEWQNSLTPYLKKEGTKSNPSDDSDSSKKSQQKSEDQFDLLEVEFQMNLQKKPP
jgi:hypothetical protein